MEKITKKVIKNCFLIFNNIEGERERGREGERERERERERGREGERE